MFIKSDIEKTREMSRFTSFCPTQACTIPSRDQIAGEGGHAAGGAQSAMAPPWFCDELGAGDRCRGNLLFYPNVLLCPD